MSNAAKRKEQPSPKSNPAHIQDTKRTHKPTEKEIDETLKETFPASDPPGHY